MTGHSVDLGELDHFVGDLVRFDAVVEKRLEHLDAEMTRLHEVWEGEAAAAQKQAHTDLLAGIEEMRTALVHLRSVTRTAHTNYGAAVQANTRMMGQVGG